MKVFLTFIFIRFNQLLIIGVPHPVLSSESEISHYSSVPTSGQSPCGVVIRSYSAQPPLQHPTHHFHLSEWWRLLLGYYCLWALLITAYEHCACGRTVPFSGLPTWCMGLVIMIMIHDELRFSFNKRIFYSSWKRKISTWPGPWPSTPLPCCSAQRTCDKEFIPLLVIKYNFKISNYRVSR